MCLTFPREGCSTLMATDFGRLNDTSLPVNWAVSVPYTPTLRNETQAPSVTDVYSGRDWGPWPPGCLAAGLQVPPAGGRPEAARRAGLEFVEKLLTANLTSTDTTDRNAAMLRVLPRPIGRAGYRSELRVVLVVVAVALRQARSGIPGHGLDRLA